MVVFSPITTETVPAVRFAAVEITGIVVSAPDSVTNPGITAIEKTAFPAEAASVMFSVVWNGTLIGAEH